MAESNVPSPVITAVPQSSLPEGQGDMDLTISSLEIATKQQSGLTGSQIESTVKLSEITSETDPALIHSQVSSKDLVPMTLAEAYRSTIDKAYPDLKLTVSGAKKVKAFIQNMRLGGSSGVLLICAGDRCEFNVACPLYQEKVHPLDQPCPLEAIVVMDTRAELSSLVDLDTRNPIIRGYISELTQIATLMWRCQMKLAYDHHDVIQQVPAVVTPEGTVHTKSEASPLLEVLDRLSSRRSRILKELALTEESRWRREAALGQKSEDSLSRVQAARKAAIQNAQGILPTAIAPPAHVQLPGVTISQEKKLE